MVGYESLLERDRLMVADQDPNVCGIASQPFWLQGTLDDGTPVRHVPDYLLAHQKPSTTSSDWTNPPRGLPRPTVGRGR
ncbi:hypothetical protein GCM10028815_20100 [Mariniluteicoccus flavus]